MRELFIVILMQLHIFKYESDENPFNEIRTIEQEDGNVLFCASDVAKILGYKNPSEAVITHCKPSKIEKCYIPHENGVGGVNLNFIPESEVYRLIMRSQLKSAEEFGDWVFEEVLPSIRRKGYYGKIDRTQAPNFFLRYKDNLHKIPRTHFSVISELFVTLNAELEKLGYTIPDKGIDGKGMYPDISVGMLFSSYLKEIDHPLKDDFQTYKHSFPDDRRDCDAKMYPLELLPEFRRFVFEKWVPQRAVAYFKSKDPVALDYFPKLLEARN